MFEIVKGYFSKIVIILLFFVFITFILNSICYGNRAINFDLSGKWDLLVSDKDNFNNSGYSIKRTECTLPGDWNDVLYRSPEFISYVWLVKQVTIPESLKNKPLVLSLGRIAVSDRAFFNGVEIGATGYMPTGDNPLDYGFALKYSRNYYIPKNLVKFGETNIISIQVFSHIFSGFADSPSITSQYNWEKQSRIIDYLPIIQNLGVLFINLLLLMILVYITDRNKRFPFVLYPFVLVIVSTLIHASFMGVSFLGDGLTRFKLILVCFIIGSLSVYLIMVNFIKKRRKNYFYFFCALSILTASVIVYTPNTNFFIFKAGPVFVGYMGFCVIFLFVPLLVRLIKEQLKYLYLWLMVAPLVFIILYSFFRIITFRVNQMPFLGFLFVPVILLNVIFYFIYDMKKNKRNNFTSIDDRAAVMPLNNKIKQKEIIHNIRQYLDDNYRTVYNRAELAKQFNIHDNYMVQLFKKVTGTTISNYINTRRIKSAMDLIENSESRIIDIAYHVGFDNLTHFYRLFKKMTGITPSDYRLQKCRNEKHNDES